MSFNIRYGTAQDGSQSWPQRRALVIDRLRTFGPDLLGLQECQDKFQAAYLQAELSDYTFIGVRRGGSDDTALEMTPVLFKTDSFERIEQGTFWLSTTPHQPGSQSWGAHPRTVTWVELRPKNRPTAQLTLVNTHFDYQPEATVKMAGLLRQWLDQQGQDMPMILTGDFNADKESRAYEILVGSQAGQGPTLRDSYRICHPAGDQREGTHHQFGQQAEPPAIDWILVSSHFTVATAEVDRFSQAGLYPSDHYPVRATVEWGG